jgi:hypothetical protein
VTDIETLSVPENGIGGNLISAQGQGRRRHKAVPDGMLRTGTNMTMTAPPHAAVQRQRRRDSIDGTRREEREG